MGFPAAMDVSITFIRGPLLLLYFYFCVVSQATHVSRPFSCANSSSRCGADPSGTVLIAQLIVSTSSHWRYPPGLSSLRRFASTGRGSFCFTTTVTSRTCTKSKYPTKRAGGSSNTSQLCMWMLSGSQGLAVTWSRLMSKPCSSTPGAAATAAAAFSRPKSCSQILVVLGQQKVFYGLLSIFNVMFDYCYSSFPSPLIFYSSFLLMHWHGEGVGSYRPDKPGIRDSTYPFPVATSATL